MTAKFTNLLNNVKIASPCSQDWNEMIGTERRRFCGECKLNVYNLSGMSKQEAENLLLNAEGRLCVRFYRRADGSVLTKDCPVGWAKIKQRTNIFVTAAFSLIFTLFSGVLFASFFARQKSLSRNFPIPVSTPELLMGDIATDSNFNKKPDVEEHQLMGAVTMGNIVVPTSTPKRRKK